MIVTVVPLAYGRIGADGLAASCPVGIPSARFDVGTNVERTSSAAWNVLGRVSVYGWEGATAVAFLNGHVAGKQPTIDEIVRRELDVFRGRHHLDLQANERPVDSIAMEQQALDRMDAPGEICKIVAFLLDELAGAFGDSKLTVELLWSIGDLVLRTKRIVLSDSGHDLRMRVIREGDIASMVQVLLDHAVDCSPLRASGRLRTDAPGTVKQPRVPN